MEQPKIEFDDEKKLVDIWACHKSDESGVVMTFDEFEVWLGAMLQEVRIRQVKPRGMRVSPSPSETSPNLILGDGEVCPKCKQENEGQTGTDPCGVCGIPTVHDDPGPRSGAAMNVEISKGDDHFITGAFDRESLFNFGEGSVLSSDITTEELAKKLVGKPLMFGGRKLAIVVETHYKGGRIFFKAEVTKEGDHEGV